MAEKSLAELIDERFAVLSARMPVLNPVALELERLKGQERIRVEEIVAVIEKDPTLASQIMRLANSAFYRGLTPVDTLSRALVRLGLKKVVSLAFAASMTLACRSQRQPFKDRLFAVWHRLSLAAEGGRWLAQNRGRHEQAEQVFLAVLLHDIGEVFLLKALEELVDEVGELTPAFIDEALAILHPRLGARLLAHWHLPEAYVHVAERHHDEFFDPSDELMVYVRLLDLACRKLGIGASAQPEIVLVSTPEAEALDLKEITLAQLEVFLEDAQTKITAEP